MSPISKHRSKVIHIAKDNHPVAQNMSKQSQKQLPPQSTTQSSTTTPTTRNSQRINLTILTPQTELPEFSSTSADHSERRLYSPVSHHAVERGAHEDPQHVDALVGGPQVLPLADEAELREEGKEKSGRDLGTLACGEGGIKGGRVGGWIGVGCGWDVDGRWKVDGGKRVRYGDKWGIFSRG